MTAKAVAMALPIPEEAPVIRADLPCRSFCPCPTMLFNQPATLSGFASGTSGEGLCGISAPSGPRNPHKSIIKYRQASPLYTRHISTSNSS